MKNLKLCSLSSVWVLCLLSSCYLQGQTQLEIQGSQTNFDTLVKIKVNISSGEENLVGLTVRSNVIGQEDIRGIAGHFFGGYAGVYGQSKFGSGIFGSSEQGAGIRGEGFSGVIGTSSSQFGNGIYGKVDGSNASGVHGVSSSQSGSGRGVKGSALQGVGVEASSIGGVALLAKSISNFGIIADSDNPNLDDIVADTSDGSNGFGTISSKRWKTNIRNIPSPIDKLSKLRGVYFNWNEELGGLHDLGFIAEEVGSVLPEIVSYEENGVDAHAVSYGRITPLLVEAANAMRKEYQGQIESQQHTIATQQQEINVLKEELSKLTIQVEGLMNLYSAKTRNAE